MYIVTWFRFHRGKHYKRQYRFPDVRDRLRDLLDGLIARLTGRHSRVRRRVYLRLYRKRTALPK